MNNSVGNDSNDQISPMAPGVGQAYFLFAVCLLLVVVLGSLIQMASPLAGLAGTELLLILLPAVIYIRLKGLPVFRGLSLHGISPGMALFSVVLGISGWGMAAGLAILSVPIIGEGPEIAIFVPTTAFELITILIVGALLAGICEEALFRGAIQGTLGRLGTKKAVVYTALLFAVFHVNPWILLPAFCLGLVYGILVVREGSVVPAMIAHTANNATAFTVAYFYADGSDFAAYPLVIVLAVVFFVVFAIYLSRVRSKPWTPLLDTVSAGLSRVMKRAITVAVILVVLFPATGLFAFVKTYKMTSSQLEPDIHQGDRVVVLKSGIIDVDINPGDIIAFRREGKTYLRKILRLEEADVWVLDGADEWLVPGVDITGRVIHVVNMERLLHGQ